MYFCYDIYRFLQCFFSFYINDLPEIAVNECYLYADDTKIVRTVDKRIQLEKDIENAIVWSKNNRLNFNFDKFKNVQFSLRKNQNKQILRFPSNGAISQETHFKQLGIYFSENLSRDHHLSFVLQKENQKLAYLKRTIPSEKKIVSQMQPSQNLHNIDLVLWIKCLVCQ